jgi:WD40 repeat protein
MNAPLPPLFAAATGKVFDACIDASLVLALMLQDSEPITALELSPDGRLLFTASRSLQLRCWALDSGLAVRSFKGHRAPIADMTVDSSNGLLATASADRTVRVWDVDGGFCTHSFAGHRYAGILLCKQTSWQLCIEQGLVQHALST